MKIVFLSVSGQLGGAERLLLDLLASLRAAEPGWRLELLCAADGPLAERARELGVAASILALPDALARSGESALLHGSRSGGGARALAGVARGAAGTARYALRLRRWLAEAQPDVVHSNGLKMHVLGAWAAPRSARLLWHFHDFVAARPLMHGLLRAHAWRCHAGVAISDAVRRDVEAALGSRLPLHTVRNAVDLETFAPLGQVAELDVLAGLPPAAPGTVRVGLVATMGRFKGHDVFLRAIARLPRDLPLRAYVVSGRLYQTLGSQFDPARLRELAGELGIGDRVGFTGFVPHPAEAMRALDVVVHASTRPEPFGLVIAEAMACARPVVVSWAGGPREIVTPGSDGLPHTPGSDAELADAILRLARDAPLRERMGRAGRAAAEARFGRARLGAEMAPVYRALAAGP